VEAIYKSGPTNMVDHTPGSAVEAGQVVVVGDLPLIAHRAIAADALGALSCGGGIYTMVAAGAAAAGVVVYWDDTNKKVTTTASTHKVFGYVAPSSSAAANNDLVDCIHMPKKAAV
jgi:predicted RecA/RadA family phage recombinase